MPGLCFKRRIIDDSGRCVACRKLAAERKRIKETPVEKGMLTKLFTEIQEKKNEARST